MADDSFDDVVQLLGEASRGVGQLWHTGAGQLPLSMLQAPLEVLKQVLQGRLGLAAEGMHVVHNRREASLLRCHNWRGASNSIQSSTRKISSPGAHRK